MPIAAKCECGKTYKLGDDAAGKKFKCKACQAVVRVPVPKTAPPEDEFDDFGDLGDDFGDDFGEDYPPEPAPPRKKSGRKAKGKSKSGGKKKPAKKKGGKKKGSSEMSPAVKYSLAGGIVVATVGLIVGILFMNGTIGGGSKSTGGDNTANNNDNTNPDYATPGGSGNGNGSGNGSNSNGNGSNQNTQPGGINWIAHNDQQGRFEVSFPGQPQRKSQTTQSPVGSVTVNIVGVELDPKSGTVVMFNDLPSNADLSTLNARRRVLNKAVSAARLQLKGRNTVSKYMTLGPHQGIEARFNTTSAAKVIVRLFLVDHRFYQVIATWDAKTTSYEEVAEKFVASFKVGGHTAAFIGKSPNGGNQPQPLAAGEFLKKYPTGDIKMQGKRVQVRGKIEKVAGQGWVFLTGDGTRNIACRIDPQPSNPPQVGQEIALDGEFGNNNPQHISMIKCKLLALPKTKPPNNSGGSSMTFDQMKAVKPAFSVNVSQIQADYAKNRKSIQKYDGKVIEVEAKVGPFQSTGKLGIKFNHPGFYLKFQTTPDIETDSAISAYVESRFYPEPWARVGLGQRVRLKGRCRIKMIAGTTYLTLTNCVYYPQQPHPAQLMTVAEFYKQALTDPQIDTKWTLKDFIVTGLKVQAIKSEGSTQQAVLAGPNGESLICIPPDFHTFPKALRQGQSVAVSGYFSDVDRKAKTISMASCLLITGKIDLSAPKGKKPGISIPGARPPFNLEPPKGGKQTGNANTKKYTNAAGRYSVTFPAKPLHKFQKVPTAGKALPTHWAVVEPSPQQRFSAIYWDVPPPQPEQLGNLEPWVRGHLLQARNDTIREYKGTSLKSTYITQGRYHGLDARFTNDRKQNVRIRVFMDKQRVYRAVAMWKAGNAEHKAAADRFVESFKVGQQQSTTDASDNDADRFYTPAELATLYPFRQIAPRHKSKIRVTGVVERVDRKGWVYLNSPKSRRVVLNYRKLPKPKPKPGDTVKVHGEFGPRKPTMLSIVKCVVVDAKTQQQ